MNDPIRNFVREHRAEFDELEPPAYILNRVRKEIQPPQPPPVKTNRTFVLTKWAVAASFLLALITYTITNKNSGINDASNQLSSAVTKKAAGIQEPKSKQPVVAVSEIVKPSTPEKQRVKAIPPLNREYDSSEKGSIVRLLSDRGSASNRISGLMRANKLTYIDEPLMQAVLKSATQDENSNVRLAAVEIIINRLGEPRMKEVLVQAFLKQDDPFVQAELIDVLSVMNAGKVPPEVKNKLLSLTNDPMTMDFVKNRTYTVLLKN